MNIPSHLMSHFPCLAAIFHCGSFTKAGEQLHVSQAAVSYQVRQLEEKLGITLIFRQSGSKVRLTNAGKLLVEEYLLCEKRLRQVLDTLDPEKLQSIICLTTPVDLGSLILPHCLALLKVKAPKLTVELSISDMMVDLSDSHYDFAIRSQAVGKGLQHDRLAVSRKSLVASRAYLQQQGKPKCPLDLADHTLLLRNGENRSWQQLFEGQNIQLDTCSDTLIMDNTFALKEGAIAGLGLAILPDFVILEAVKNKQLFPLLSNYSNYLATDFYLSYVPTPQAEVIKTLLINTLVDVCNDDRFKGGFI